MILASALDLSPVQAISASAPDWSREQPRRLWDPPRRLLSAIRDYQHWHGRLGPLGACMARIAVLRYRFWSVITGCDIPVNTRLGGGLLLHHPNGIVIHPDALIGPNCAIFQQVTIGTGGPIPGVPTLEGHVDVGAGAKLLGGIHVGEHARIGANAVVLCDVPAGATAVGIPARIIPAKECRG